MEVTISFEELAVMVNQKNKTAIPCKLDGQDKALIFDPSRVVKLRIEELATGGSIEEK